MATTGGYFVLIKCHEVWRRLGRVRVFLQEDLKPCTLFSSRRFTPMGMQVLGHGNVSAKKSDSTTLEGFDSDLTLQNPVHVPASSLCRWATRTSSTGSTPPRGLFLIGAGLSAPVPFADHASGRQGPGIRPVREIVFRVVITRALVL